MAKQLNVDMRFNADTSQAKRAIQDLQNSLSTIAKMPGNASNLFDDTEIKKASQAALELQGHLQKAVNVNTGKLDLSRFASSLKTSNKDLSMYANTLLNTGKQGQQAFLQLAQAIATADTPVTRINAKLTDLGVTLKNTAKWQISSSVLHGFMGAVQSAYGYAQDLNESLNNIRIVTGQNIDQMARFAETANRAAKALSTTTTDYTNASLIYYQQGLNDSQVQERTDITIKMANVARQSAEIVSDQMTAVWNNFDNGSKSLEYYADVMTALGAATASSTDEIAEGLEKFAAISSTVGLSYEYATAALATVTDKTRQSADVVGTAFKTMFARIQGLELGETLDDGTNLNKYSEALAAVGVSIKDSNGELRDMDNILNDMASVWETLNRDQQVALAQTVAGVRQYSQLMALMENWDAMEINLGVVETSEGALQEQADIYAESWEAAQDRVRAAAEGIYQNLIDDEFFITLLNGFEKVIETIGGVVQGLGGMQGVITLVGSLFLTQFAQKMPEALSNLRQNFMVFTGQSKKVMSEMQNELNLTLTAQKADPGLSESYKIQLEGIQKINTMKQKLVSVSKSLTSQEQEEYKMKIQNVEAMYKEAAALAEKKKAAEELEKKTQKIAETTANQKANNIFKEYNDSEAEVSNLMDKATTPSKSAEETAIYAIKIEEARKKAVELEMSIEKIGKAAELSGEEIQALMGVGTASQQAAAQDKVAKKVKETSDAFKEQIKQRSNLEEMNSAIVSQGKAWEKVAQEIKKVEPDKVKNLSSTIDTTKQKMAAYLQIIQKIASDNGLELNAEDIEKLANKIKTLDSSNIEEITQDFSTFANEVSGKAQNAIGGLDASIGQLRGTMSDLQFDSTEVDEMEQAAAGAATATQELRNSMDNIGGIADENVEGTFKMSVALTEFASVAMSVSSLISSLRGAINTFTDEGASGFEKFGALLSTIMPLISTFNALQSFATTLSKNATIAKWAETKATTAATTAKWAENAAWLASPITWIVGAILGVVAALGLLVAGISAVTKALNDSYNAEAIAAENAAQAASNLADKYEETKAAYEDMISTMENYQSARDGLDSLTKGTEEYRKQLNEANKEALKLIELMGLTKDNGYTVSDDGEIIINEESFEYQEAKAAQFTEIQKAYASSIMASAQSKAATAKANQTEFVRNSDNVSTEWNIQNKDLYNGIESNKINKLTESYKQLGEAAFESSNLTKLGFEASNTEYINGVKEVVRANVEGSYALSTAAQLATNALLDTTEGIQNLGIKDDIAKASTNTYIDEYDAAYKTALKKTKNDGLFGIGSEKNEEIWQDYVEAALSDLKDVTVENFKKGGDVDYSYTTIDENGKEITETKTVTQEEIAAAVAAREAAEKMLSASTTITGALENLAGQDINQADLVSSSLVDRNLLGASYDQLSSFATEDDAFDKESFINYIKENLSVEELSAFGYESAEAYANAFQIQFDSAMSEWNGLESFKDYSLGEAQSLNDISSQTGVDTESIKNYYDNLDDEEKTIFLNLDFDKNKSKENWDAAIKDIKEDKIEVQIETKASDKAAANDLDAKLVEDISKSYIKLNKIVDDGTTTTEAMAEAATDAATRYVRLQDAVIDLSENYEDYDGVLKDLRNNTDDIDRAMIMNSESARGLKSSMADLLGTSEDLISADLLAAIDPTDFENAARGDEAAINRIRDAFIELEATAAGINASGLKEELAGLEEGVEINLGIDSFLSNLLTAKLNAGASATEIDNLLSGFGIDMDNISYYDSLADAQAAAAETGGIIADELTMSQDTEVEATEVEKNGTDLGFTEEVVATPVPATNYVTEIDENGEIQTKELPSTVYSYSKSVTENSIPTKETETVTKTDSTVTRGNGEKTDTGKKGKFAVITGRKSVGGNVSGATQRTANNNVNKAKSGKGGGSKPKKAQPTKKSDIVDRYKEQDDKLDDLKRTMDNTADSFDRLYGEDKLEAIDKLIQAEKDYKDVLKEKRSEARDALDEDRKALDAAASKVSVEFEYDAEGNLINYTEQMEALYNRLRATEKAAGAEWTESEQEQIDALKEKIEALKEAKEQYEDTRELIEDLSDELKDLAGKPAMPLIKSDTVDIYREISDALDDIEEKLDRIARKSDNALGKNRLNYFKDFQETSEEKLSLLEDEIASSTTDIRQNKTFLNRVTKLLDVDKVQYDKKGNIVNYDEITNVLWDRIFQFQEKAKKGGITPAEQQALDALYADLNLFTSSSDKYRDSVEYREDLRLEKEELTEGVKVLPLVTNDFLDIYKEADDILDDIEDKTSQIAEEAERATGKDKVANLKELAKLEKERLAYIKKEQEINTSDKQEKRKALGTARKRLGVTTKFKFDENGNITNYNEIMQEYEQKYAQARADAAADGTITAEENEWLEKFKEDGQYLEEYIQQYSDAVEEGEKLKQAAIDAAYAAEDYLLEALNFTIEFGIEANDRDLQQIEFQLSQLEDQAYMTAEAMTLLDKKYQNLQRQTDIYTDGINTILSDNFTQDEIDQFLASGDLSGLDLSKISQTELDMLNSYADGLVGLQEELLALRDTMNGAVIKAFEEWTAEMQEQLSLFDHYDSVINSYTNIIDLVGQERLGITDENIKEYNQLKVNNATNRLTSSKAYYEETGEKIQSLEAKRAESQARLEAAQSSGDASAIAAAQNELKSWDEALKAMREENRNAEQQYLSDWEAALQASRDAFLAETDIQLKALEERMTGTYGTIANMQEEFKRQTEKNDRYLQDYEKIYELSKLNRDLTNKMDETTNIKAKKELAKLQEEILDYQKEGRQMSDYDLKYLKKKYELKLAEIALEEAQNAKTQVRLTRDSEGNYSYTYTADEDSMAKAQQTYEDKLYEITILSNDYIEQQTSKLLSAQQEYVNKLAEIHKKAAEGQYATTEEYQQALDEVTAYYTDLMIYYGDEIDKAAENNATVYENDYQTYSGYALSKADASKEEAEEYINWVQAKSAAEAGFITSITELLPGLSDAHSNATGYVESMVKTIGSAKEETGLLGQASESYKTLSGNIEEAMQAAGTSMGTFKDTTYEKLITDEDSIANALEETKNNILGIVSATDALDDTIEAVANWQTKYSNELQKIIDKAGDVVTAINNMNLVLAQQAADEEDKEDPQPGDVAETLENPIDLEDEKNKKEEETPKLTQTASSLITSVIPDIVKKTNPPSTEDNSNKLETASEKTKKGVAYAIWSGYWGNGNSRKTLVNKKLGKGAYATYQELVNDYDIATKAKNGTWEKDLFGKYLAAGEGQKKLKNTYGPSAFFTGGYTGAWGPNGKLAILHEKELVLNKQDTENMLKIVSMVRDLSAALDSKAYYASLAQLQANQLYQVNPTGETFEQTVTIHAEFPHATNAIEIETALNNLVNSASQYANRK